MADLMTAEPQLISLISRFGVPFGVSDQTIEDVCQTHGIDTVTFLAVVNHVLCRQAVDLRAIHLPTLQTYIRNAHVYYLQHHLPYLRRTLIEAMPSGDDHQVVILILRYYDAFVQVLKRHMHAEDAGLTKGHERDDQHMVSKLSELTGLIVKYYPTEHSEELNPAVVHALNVLHRTETEILVHCQIEDNILIPAQHLQGRGEARDTSESLSERETDVLIQIVRGYSNKQIADHLCLSVHTVISHRKNIVRKLGIHSTAGLTIYAVVNNLVRLEELQKNL